jgi:hypothetical protein
MEKIKLNFGYRGHEVEWDDSVRKFKIFKNGVLVKEKIESIEDSQKWIDEKNRKNFKRIPILYNFNDLVDDLEKGEATSFIDAEFIWLSSGGKRCKAKASQVWLDTPENREILKVVKEKRSLIDQLWKEIAQIKNNAKRINVNMLLGEDE